MTPIAVASEIPMNQFKVEMSRDIPAPPEAVYAVIADYRVGHPAILPKQFTLHLESGGAGAGTVFRLDTRFLGRTQSARMAVTEPQPGRLLVETTLDGTLSTRFIFDPIPDGTRVTFSTVGPVRGGLAGRIERWFIVRFLRGIYAQELGNLAAYVASRPAGAKA